MRMLLRVAMVIRFGSDNKEKRAGEDGKNKERPNYLQVIHRHWGKTRLRCWLGRHKGRETKVAPLIEEQSEETLSWSYVSLS